MSYQPGGLVLPDLSRRGYLSKNASSSNRFGLVNGDGLSKDSRCWCTFSRWRSSMDNAIACSSSLVIVCTWKAIYRSTSHYGKMFYCCNLRNYSGQFGTHCININNLILLCVFKENTGIFHINLPLFISDHLIKNGFILVAPTGVILGVVTFNVR